MFADAREVPAGSILEREVCVIGAGAAGIALGLELARAPFRVAILESGGFDAEPETQDLYRGRIHGRAYHPLHEARTRRFGGSTQCWSGLCRPLDALDFEARDWVPHSGWPFGEQTLRPFDDRARLICGLGDPTAEGPAGALPLAGDLVETRRLEVAPTRFGELHRAAIASAPSVETFLHANAIELVSNEAGTLVESVRVATLAGGAFELRAGIFVLATGGIENARLLLASNRRRPSGIGNEHDLVGRFFMDHPHFTAAAFLPAHADRVARDEEPPAGGAASVLAAFAPAPAAQARERILGFWAVFAGEGTLPGFERSLARSVNALEVAAGEPASRASFLLAAGEQAPNPHSRVRLTDERDALGLPRVQLEWRLSELDRRSMLRAHQLLARELGRSGLGRLQILIPAEEAAWPDGLAGGRHHIGTTRMHEDPRRGVVDARCRVHGVANLYVAGSSVFPTSGSSAPTLTLVALAVRLADDLKVAFA